MNARCVLCNSNLCGCPQAIPCKSKHWVLLHDLDPICDFHCILVYKHSAIDQRSSRHVSCLSADMDVRALKDLGQTLHDACTAIKMSSPSISRVHVASLNSGERTKHLHFHLIPVYVGDVIKKVGSADVDGGAFRFLSEKEVLVDALSAHIISTCGPDAADVLSAISAAKINRIKNNVAKLRKHHLSLCHETR